MRSYYLAGLLSGLLFGTQPLLFGSQPFAAKVGRRTRRQLTMFSFQINRCDP
jgi:hypothetical protein